MSTNKPRIMVTVSDDVYQRIENYRYENRFKSQSLAVNDLIGKGIQVLLGDDVEEPKKNPAIPDGISEDEKKFLTGFTSLTPSNRHLLLGIVELLLQEQARTADSQG